MNEKKPNNNNRSLKEQIAEADKIRDAQVLLPPKPPKGSWPERVRETPAGGYVPPKKQSDVTCRE